MKILKGLEGRAKLGGEDERDSLTECSTKEIMCQ